MTDRTLSKAMFALVFAALSTSGFSQSTNTEGGASRQGQGQQNPRQEQNSRDPQRGQDTAPGQGKAVGGAHTAGDADVTRLIQINVAEVEAGKMAATKAENDKVKDFANMMVKDHTDALAKIHGMQGNPSTDMKPDAKQQQQADRLSKLSGAAFDREYMKAQVEGHQEAVKFLERHARNRSANANPAGAAKTGANTDLASLAEEMLPTVRHHLELAQEIQKDLRNGGAKARTSTDTKSNSAPAGSDR